jgi:hypothetical protein
LEILRRLLIPIFLTGISQSAFSYWDVEVGGVAAHLSIREFSPVGNTIVREDGHLHGFAFSAIHKSEIWSYYIQAVMLQGDLSYRGQNQSGVAQASITSTRLRRISTGTSLRVSPATRLFASVEQDCWGRDIQANGDALGLTESYRSRRILTGVDALLYEGSVLMIKGKFALVFSSAEAIRVQFDQSIFDPVDLRSKPGIGARASLSLVHQNYPHLSLNPEFDWIRVRTGDAVTLKRNGSVVGSVSQPEHTRMQWSAKLAYRF